MSRTHCKGSRRGHTWREVHGARGAELAKRVCIKCDAPGRVDSQGRVVLVPMPELR